MKIRKVKNMRIFVTEDYKDLSKKAADIIAAQVILKPSSVLGLATGSTPVGMYGELVKKYRAGELDFGEIKTANLDEYAGLEPTHEQSYRYFMQKNLFDHVNIRPQNTHVPNGASKNPEEECKEYDRILDGLGGVDIQVLGIGHNGHIGFNEPSEAFERDTHVVELQKSTIDANSRFFSSVDEIPKKAITMGIGSIMRARCILLLASGEGKAEIIKQALRGPITPYVPASVLQLHPNVIVVCDKGAASKL